MTTILPSPKVADWLESRGEKNHIEHAPVRVVAGFAFYRVFSGIKGYEARWVPTFRWVGRSRPEPLTAAELHAWLTPPVRAH
jgi:hypothetical protein